jgi:hypothetical protein
MGERGEGAVQREGAVQPEGTAQPAWLRELARDPAVARLGIRWLDRGQRDEATNGIRGRYGDELPLGVLHTDATLNACRRLVADVEVVATGPQLGGEVEGTGDDAVWLLDPKRPDGLLLALSEEFPPLLWLEAGRTLADLRTTLAEFWPGSAPAPTRLTLRRRVRGFLCRRGDEVLPNPYSGEPDEADFHAFSRHFVFSPFVRAHGWGSSQLDDPWPSDLSEVSSLAMIRFGRQMLAQHAERVPSETYRTRYSRAYLGIQAHPGDLLLAEIRYQPARHQVAIELVNAELGLDLPLDVPVDAVGAVFGFPFVQAGQVEAALAERAEDPGRMAGLVGVLGALLEGDLLASLRLRQLAHHHSAVVRAAVGNVALGYNLEFLLHEMCLAHELGGVEADDRLAREVEGVLATGIANPFAPDEDDEDDDE